MMRYKELVHKHRPTSIQWFDKPAIGSEFIGKLCGELLTLTGFNNRGWLMLVNYKGIEQSGHPNCYELVE